MKKLSDLVNYKNQLDCLSTRESELFANAELSKITHLVNDADLYDDLDAIKQAFAQFDATLDKVRADLKGQIEQAERPWFQASYTLHETESKKYTTDHIFDVRMTLIPSELRSIIEARIKLYTSWHYAAMLIRPGPDDLIDHFVGFDPLYIIDRDYELLTPAVSKFNEVYQNRLRQYVVKDLNDDILFEQIPDGQFALCVAYMYFNYKPIELIKQYFTELYQKLKPGGILGFTFNDGNRAAAVRLVEDSFCCYTPGSLIKELARSVGFEIDYEWSEVDGPLTWLELRKPGTLSSLKGGQTLAKILPKAL